MFDIGNSWQAIENRAQKHHFSSTFSIRYVAYYEKMKSNGRVLPEAVPLMLTQIQITGGCSIAMQDIPKTQNNFRPHVLWSRGRLWLLCGGWSGDHDFANVETKFWFSSPFSSFPLDCCRLRVGEIQSSTLTLGTCWTASQSMMLALTCLLFRWFKSCNNPYFNIGTKIRLSLPI